MTCDLALFVYELLGYAQERQSGEFGALAPNPICQPYGKVNAFELVALSLSVAISSSRYAFLAPERLDAQLTRYLLNQHYGEVNLIPKK